MISIQGYQIKEKLFESNNSLVFRAVQDTAGLPVVIKLLKGEYPNPDRIARFNREFEILKNLNIDGIIKAYSLENFNNSCAIIMEDIGGESIKKLLQNRRLSLDEFLRLSIRISDILGQMHQLNIIHKNINPTNIVWNQKTDRVKIIDLGISTVLTREIASIQNPNEFEGTLSYVSPEQTGRMNRMLDYRTDMYSLGVTMYEMITGELPFPDKDPMQLVHCHIAKDPVPPHKLKYYPRYLEQSEGAVISRIILKLMSKNAEERYQNVYGLKADLENCLEQLYSAGKILDFEIGGKDFSERFQIPQKLYGRGKETASLINTFNSICQGTKEILMVTGPTGIGKTALVNEIHKTVVAKKGYFISGKFEQFRRNIPYSSLLQAFQQLIKQILTESEEQISIWKKEITEAIGPNGQVIIDVIPEAELIIGRQPPVPALPPQESQNRFNFYFKNFIRTFANESHPITIFLDALQWVDIPSLHLVELFMTDSDTKYLFLIGAYRDNEINQSHPLSVVLEKIKKAGTMIKTLPLSSLDYETINLILADTLKCHPEKTGELAKLCMKKTNGNPFFLIQFLQTIHENRLFEFDSKQMIWRWEIGSIQKMKVTDNVVDLMVSKIQKLPEKTQYILKLAACIGAQFDLRLLSFVYEKTPAETAEDLWEALVEEVILPISDIYRFVPSDYENAEVCYKFSHDRIQQAVHSLIEEGERKRTHWKIGRMLMSITKGAELDDKILNIANQLNSGFESNTGQDEKYELARLNFMAGIKAKSANANEIAYQYFSFGVELLGKDCWKDHYILSLKMYTEAAEALFLTGNFDRMDDLAKEVLRNSSSLLDRIKINEVIIQSFISRLRLPEVLKTAVDILKQLGVKIPKKPTILHVLYNFLRIRISLFGKDTEDLKSIPEMSDPFKLAAMRILMSAASTAYRGHTLMAIMMALKMVRLTLKYGNSQFSPYGYSMYGIVVLRITGNILQGYKFGNFSIELMKKYKTREYNAKLIVLFNFFIRLWKDKVNDTIDALKEAFKIGLETGDFEFAAYSIMYASVHSLFCGKELNLIDKEMEKYVEIIIKLKQERTIYNIKLHRQLILNLLGHSKYRTLLVGDDFNEEEMLPVLIRNNDSPSIGALYVNKTIICYTFENFRESFQNAIIADRYKGILMGLIYLPMLYYYTSLAYLSYLPGLQWNRRVMFLSKVYRNQRTMKKWSLHAPDNYLHKWSLVQAEKFRVLNKDKKALFYYDKAIKLARSCGFIQEEALACELLAKYYLVKGNESPARRNLAEARYLYSRWGAKAKVQYLDEKYHDLLSAGNKEERKGEGYEAIKTAIYPEITSTVQLDLRALQKASETISSEIHLEKLLEKLLGILVTNAGAIKGHVLLMEGDKLFEEGETSAEEEKINVLKHIPYQESKNISQVIVNYVLRTGETLVLDNAADDEIFKNDILIIRNQSKSLFCMPLVYQNKLSGILYLENNLIPGAFTSERVEILKMLSGQIVISIENARLYKNLEEYNRNLEEKVSKRTIEISLKNEQLNVQKEELRTTLENLKHSQVQLVQSEKMASLGQLVAGIAHEINNPITFISAGVDSLKTNLDEIGQVLAIYQKITPENVSEKLKDIEKVKGKVEYRETVKEINRLIESIKNGSRRTTEIVKGLRTFSRLDEDIIKTADIHEGLDSTLILLHNKYNNRIEIVRNYENIPPVECYPGPLNQVFMNILSNAIDAIDDKGTITISTSKTDRSVEISILDTGRGIPENLKEKIFEPFYTTKEVGKGTGLGLSISHGIIQKHRGSINFKSEVGKGSEFIISLPLKANT